MPTARSMSTTDACLAALRSARPPAPLRTLEPHLSGHVERYAGSIDGVKFADARLLCSKYGERLRLALVNDTIMHHPIHLHGMWSDLEAEHGNFKVRQQILDIPPDASIESQPTRWGVGPATAT